MKTQRYFVVLLLLTLFSVTSCSYFQKYKQELTIEEVENYARFAGLSYQEKESIQSATPLNFALKAYQLDEVAGQFLLLIDHEKKEQFIVIRGTDNISNVVTDLRYVREFDPTLRVYLHVGFADYSKAILTKLQVEGFAGLDKSYSTIVIGHSLGGAAAEILGGYLEHEGFHVSFIVTYGQPRVTNEEGAEELNRLPLVRVVNNGDPVSKIPVITLLTAKNGHFVHSGLELLLFGDTKFRLEFAGDSAGDPLTMEAALQAVNPVDKHGIGFYQEKLTALAARLKGFVLRFKDGFEWSLPESTPLPPQPVQEP